MNEREGKEAGGEEKNLTIVLITSLSCTMTMLTHPRDVLHLSFEQLEFLDGAHAAFERGGREWARWDDKR